ncbi:MAG: hypothetical protein R3A51_11960 [Nannocystaceae bacterium]
MSRSDRRVMWIAALGCALALIAGEARAAPLRVIPPGKEAKITEFVRGGLGRAGLSAPRYNVAVDRDRIVVDLEDPAVGPLKLSIVGPGGEPGEADGEGVAPGVALRCPAACTGEARARAQPIAAVLSQERDTFGDQIWEVVAASPSPPAARPGPAAAEPWYVRFGLHDAREDRPRARWTSIAVAGYALLWALVHAGIRLARRRRQLGADLRRHAPALALLALFIVACLTIPALLPIHDHNSYVARSDCAASLVCDRDPRAPAWSAPTFHVYGLLLQLLPYRMQSLALVSLLCSAVALALLYALVRRVFALRGEVELGACAAIWTLAFAALHPLAIRNAVSGIFWPYTLCCLFAAGVATLSALRTRRITDAVAAAAFTSLTLTGNLVCLALAPLIVLAPLCWWTRGQRPPWIGWLLAAALVGVHAGPYFLAAFEHHVVGGASMERFDGSPVQLASQVLGNAIYLNALLTPVAVGALALVGGVVAAWRLRLASLPFFYALAATEVPLGRQVDPFTVGYPTRYIHGHVSLSLCAALAGVGAAWLVIEGARRLAPRLGARARPVAIVTLAALCLAGLPWARESLSHLRDERVLAREIAGLSVAFDALPEHDLLVIPPVILPAPEGVEVRSDPVEAFFPLGEYRARMSARGLAEATVIELPALLASDDRSLPPRALVYVGATLQMFLRDEVSAGAVPPDRARAELRELRERYTLSPAYTFTLATAQHPAVAMRLAGDQVDAVEVGFYWLRARGDAVDSPGKAR